MVDNAKFDIEAISELIEGAGVFDSRGFSVLKITKKGKQKLIRLPIKSSGVAEYQAELANQAPRPPVKRELVTKESPEGKALNLPKDTVCNVFDLTDENYVDAKEQHDNDFAWRLAVFALDVPFKTADGQPVESYEDKKRILQSNGITGNHLAKIYRDVENLTAYAEERNDFLSEN